MGSLRTAALGLSLLCAAGLTYAVPGEGNPAPAVGAIPVALVKESPAGTQAGPSFDDRAAQNAASAQDTPPLEVEVVREAPAPVSSIDLTQQPSDLWDRIRAGFSMPDLHSPLVTNRQQWYAARPDLIKQMVERSRPYLFHIVEELERRGMPTELALLPMVESAFNPMAFSRAQASGLWQFIPSTGKTYRLDQNWWYDGRRDIVASTAAALDYLQTIYEMSGDWDLALASYNWGENAVARAIEHNRKAGKPTDYLSLKMPTETRYYVPKLQALKNIVMNPAAFGVQLDPIPNAPYFATVQLNRDIDLELAARFADMPVEDLIALNPGHNRPVVTSAQSISLVLPADKLESFLENVADNDRPLTAWTTYSAKRGERVEKIAADHGMTVEQLRDVNGIRGKGKLQNDVDLLVPATAEAQLPEGLFKAPATIWAEPETVRILYTATKKDTWASIARKLRVRTADLQKWNSSTKLVAGAHVVAYRREGPSTKLVSNRSQKPSHTTARKPASTTKAPVSSAGTHASATPQADHLATHD